MAMTREQAWELLTKYNEEPFHLRHAITVEHVMGWYAQQLGYGEERNTGLWWACSTIWILSSGRRSTASSLRN